MITQCIDDPWKATIRKIKKTKLRKKSVGAEKMRNLIGAKKVNRSQVSQWNLSNREI